MVKKYLWASFLGMVMVFLTAAMISAETVSDEEFEAKRKALRVKKAEITQDYKRELAKADMASDEKLSQIKADFHKKRDEELKDRAGKENELKDAYEKKIGPVLEEEKMLIESLGPGRVMNFAKPKSERIK